MFNLISALFMIPIEALYPYIIFILAGRILLCGAVYYDLKRRGSSNMLPWLVSTLIFGLFGAVLFGIFNGKSNKKGKVSILILLVLCYVLVLAGTVAYTALYVAPKSGEYEPEFEYKETFYMGEKVYRNDAGEDIIYDKTGYQYTYDERNDFRYYDENGNRVDRAELYMEDNKDTEIIYR